MKSRWSVKYKKSINCSSPRGFSQKNYCARKKRGGHYLEGFKEYIYEMMGSVGSIVSCKDLNNPNFQIQGSLSNLDCKKSKKAKK
jgi:hypothetical protein